MDCVKKRYIGTDERSIDSDGIIDITSREGKCYIIMSTKELTAQQRRYCVNLADGMKQSKAYSIAFDYTGPNGDKLGSRLLMSNGAVKAYTDALLERQAARAADKYSDLIMQPNEIKARLSQLARSSLATILDDNGSIVVSKDTDGIEAVRSLTVKRSSDGNGGEDVTNSVKLINPIEPLRELSKIHGLYAPAKSINAHRVQFDVTLVDKTRLQEDTVRLPAGTADPLIE